MSTESQHHDDVEWCTIGEIAIMYHTSVTVSTSVTYDERSVFGSHGMYAVWTGTAPRTVSVSANLVGGNVNEVAFNMLQVKLAYDWTQCSPPQCKLFKGPTGASSVYNMSVRIESFDTTIPESTHLGYVNNTPIQIEFSLGLKECKAI